MLEMVDTNGSGVVEFVEAHTFVSICRRARQCNNRAQRHRAAWRVKDLATA